MASVKQIDLFERLSNERQFPEGTDLDALRAKFATVPDKSASNWIERALALPEKGAVPPPF